MLKKVCLCIIFIFMMLSITSFVEAADQVIVFEDSAMYQKVKSELDRQAISYVSYDNTNKSITMTEVNIDRVTLLNISNNSINSLAGIEKFTKLWHLYATNNNISSISPLKNLTRLDTILLSNNNISDISDFENLTNLTELQINDNRITDVSVLSNLQNLNRVFLSNNLVADISFVDDLSSLSLLVIKDNNVSITLPDLNKNENKTIAFPSIFKYAKIQGSSVYTSDDLTLTNCTISGNNIVLNTSNTGNIVAKIKINSGNAEGTTYTINYTVKGTNTEPTLNKIEITKAPNKTNYTIGEKFDKTGMIVTAIYSDGTQKEITNYTISPNSTLTKNDSKITVSYTEDGITETITYNINVKESSSNNPPPVNQPPKELPKAGIVNSILLGITITSIAGLISYIRYKKYNF